MESTTIVKTAFEFSVMPVQRYEFTCTWCFLVKTVNDHGKPTNIYGMEICTACDPRLASF